MIRNRFSKFATLATITVVVWMLAFTNQTTRSFLDRMPGEDPSSMVGQRLLLYVGGIGISGLLYLLLSRTERWRLMSRFWAILALALFGGLFYAAANELVFYHLLPVPLATGPTSPVWLRLLMVGTWQAWTFLACLGAYLGLSYSEQVRERERQLMRAESLAVDAQNRMLRQQINPHFLFNTLNALSTLVLQGRNATAERMILSLAKFMRRSLQVDSASLVTLTDEVEAEAEYLSIEQVRFGERLKVVWDISDEASQAWVPSLILQPIVENAVKYGVAGTGATVTITVRARVENRRLLISVIDDGGSGADAPPTSGLGVGLENVRQRLQALYGSDGEVRWGPAQPRGFRVELGLPLSRRAAAA